MLTCKFFWNTTFSKQVLYDFEIRDVCHNTNGFLEFWLEFSDVVPDLFENKGVSVITGFEKNPEIKSILLLLKLLIPKNYASVNLIPAINNLIRTVKVCLIINWPKFIYHLEKLKISSTKFYIINKKISILFYSREPMS